MNATKAEILKLRAEVREIKASFQWARTKMQLMLTMGEMFPGTWEDLNLTDCALSRIVNLIEEWASRELPEAPDGN